MTEQLTEISQDPDFVEPLLQTEWMELAEMEPDFDYNILNEPEYDASFDWLSYRHLFTNEEVQRMSNWIESEKQKEHLPDVQYDIVQPEQLNKQQRFAFDLIKYHYERKQQLLRITKDYVILL